MRLISSTAKFMEYLLYASHLEKGNERKIKHIGIYSSFLKSVIKSGLVNFKTWSDTSQLCKGFTYAACNLSISASLGTLSKQELLLMMNTGKCPEMELWGLGYSSISKPLYYLCFPGWHSWFALLSYHWGDNHIDILKEHFRSVLLFHWVPLLAIRKILTFQKVNLQSCKYFNEYIDCF